MVAEENIKLVVAESYKKFFLFVPGLAALHRTALSPFCSSKAAAQPWRSAAKDRRRRFNGYNGASDPRHSRESGPPS